MPEMFKKDHPWEGPPCIGVNNRGAPLAGDQQRLFSDLQVIQVTDLKDVMVRPLLEQPGRLIWNHNGLCHCGRRTFLFSQCDQCAEREAIDRQLEGEASKLAMEWDHEQKMMVDRGGPIADPNVINGAVFLKEDIFSQKNNDY